jgi:hypothetical protein
MKEGTKHEAHIPTVIDKRVAIHPNVLDRHPTTLMSMIVAAIQLEVLNRRYKIIINHPVSRKEYYYYYYYCIILLYYYYYYYYYYYNSDSAFDAGSQCILLPFDPNRLRSASRCWIALDRCRCPRITIF